MSPDDNGRSDEYWMGVRDALRMVDSFNKWSRRNPGRAKSLEDFIHDGLIAAAKRCESCLQDKMGISFAEEDEVSPEESVESDIDDNVALDEVSDVEEEPVLPDSSLEVPITHVDTEPYSHPSEDLDETSITLDSVERRDDEEMGDLSIEGPPREFSTDFELVEPTPLVVDEDGTVSEPEPETEYGGSLNVPPKEEIVTTPEIEEVPDKPAFTWSEYEETVSPFSEPEPPDEDVDIVESEDETMQSDEPEDAYEAAPNPPEILSPYKEQMVSEEDDFSEDDASEIDDSLSDETEDDAPVISEPPAPPPPPESEEDEEERKRRARRLFFGA